jgi:hypothetical protein
LQEELKPTFILLRKTTTTTTKSIPQVIVISYSKEEMEVGPQHVI